MWPLPRISNDIIAISFAPQAVSFAWIQKSSGKFQHRLKAFKTTTFESADALLVPMRLRSFINEFLKAHCLPDASVFFSLNRPSIIDKIITLPTKNPQPEQFEQPHLQSLIWDSQLLYQQDYNHWAFYLSCMKPETLFQYKVLAASCNLNLRSIVPSFISYLQLHRAYKKDPQTDDRFGDHMMTQQNNIQSLITINDIASLVAIDPTIHFDDANDFEIIKELIGLACGEGTA